MEYLVGNREYQQAKSMINPENELRLQKIGKKLHKSLFRKAKFEETKDGLVIHQQKKRNLSLNSNLTSNHIEKDGSLINKKAFPIKFLAVQRFAKPLKKKTPANVLGWDKDHNNSSYRLQYTTPKKKVPMAIYFNQPSEAYEFLIKSDIDLKSSLCHVLDDYKRKKDETRMELNKGSLLDKIRYYADAKKRRNLAFLEQYDDRITKEMLIKWLEMSKFIENLRQKMAQEPEKPLEKSVDLQEEDPFEEQKRQIEQRMREKEEEERRLQEEEDFRMRMMMIQQYIRSIQKNQAFLDCNRFHLNRLVRNWREKALAIQHQKLQDQKAKPRSDSKSSIFIKVLEITQSVIPNPSLSLVDDNNRGSSYELKVVGQVKPISLFASKVTPIRKEAPKEGSKEAQKEEKMDYQATQILWQTRNEALLEAKTNSTEKNAVTFTLSDASHSAIEFQAKVQLSEFLKESTTPLKVYYLTLHPDRDDQKHGLVEPLIKFKVFIGDQCPREREWDLDLVKDLQKGNIKDPVYDEIMRLPKYTPKNIGFLIEILRTWGLFDIEMNYRRLVEDFKFKKPESESSYLVDQAQPVNKKLLQEVIETLYDFMIDETSKSHARSQGNLKVFLELESKMSKYLNGELNKVKEPHHYYDIEEDENNLGERMNDEEKDNLLRLKVKVAEMRLRINEGKSQVNNGKSEKEIAPALKLQGEELKAFEKICLKGGTPNEKRPFLWSFLGNVEEIKIKAVEFANGSDHVTSYERATRPKTEKLNPNNSLSFIYTRLLSLAESTDECQLVRQMIADDIALLNESEDFSNEEEEKLINKILLAFAFLMEKLKSSDPMHLNPYKHIFYSMPIMKITRKIIALTHSKFLDQENMNMECFNNYSHELNHSPNQSHSKKNPMQREFEQNVDPRDSKEALAFWMLVSMVTHVLPGYFIGVPHELNKEIKTPLRESYQDEIGLKRDLLILKFYIKEHEPAIFQLFEDVSLPLEFFYGNMLLCAGSDMLHNEVLYRIWDLMYLQKEKDQDPHFVLISLVILILRISKDHILKGFGHADCKHAAKDSREINDILKIFETVSRFLPNPDDVIAELLLIQQSLVEFIRKHYGEFHNLRNDLNTKFQNIRHQNKMFYDLVHKKNNFENLKDKVGVFEIFKLMELLKGRHKLFLSGYRAEVELSVPEEFDKNDNPEEREKQELSAQLPWFRHFESKNNPEIIIHLFLHKMTLFGSREEQPFKLEIIYQGVTKAILPVEFNTTCYLNHYMQIPYNYEKREIVLQITLEREFLESMKSPKTLSSLRDVGTNKTSETMPSMSQLAPTKKKWIVKEAVINLDSFMVNYLQKSIARLDFTTKETELNEDHNLTTSEIDFSLVLSTESNLRALEAIENSYRNNAKLLAQSLPKPLFKYETFDKIKEMNLEKFHEKFLKNLVNVLSLEHISTASFAINPNEWRKNSKITYEQFRETLKAAKFVETGTLDYFALYNSIMNSNRDKTFYFTDFLILLILFSHTTPKQKSLLFYDTLMLFDNTQDLCNGISIQTVKSFTSYLYEVFMLSIPHHHVDNIIEFLSGGYVSGILSAKLDYKMQENQEKIPQTLNFTNALINVSNYLHYYYNTKQLFLGDPNKMSLLKEVLENMNEDIRDISKALPPNEYFRLNLKYRQRGMKHKMQFLFDNNWNIVRKLVLDPEVQELKIQSPEKYKLIENLLIQNENVIPLGDLESFLSQQDFLQLMEKLPMMNYLLGFSIFENTIIKIPKISCSIKLEDDLISSVDDFLHNDPKYLERKDYNNDYKDLSYQWFQTRNDISNQLTKSFKAKASTLKFYQYPSYESFFKTLQLIQKRLMQNYLFDKNTSGNAVDIRNYSVSAGISPFTKGKQPPEYSRIFDLDFRRVQFQIGSNDSAISGLFFYSLFDLAWLINQNRRGVNTGEMSLFIKYFKKSSEEEPIPRKPNVIVYDHFKRFELKYQCLALFFYSYQSKEWLPCKIMQRFYSKRKKESKSTVPSYYGVVFQNQPDSTFS